MITEAIPSLPNPEIKRLVIVTDAWQPQVNGVVRTLGNTCAHLNAMGVDVQMVTPLSFKTLPCPTYPEIRLSLATAKRLQALIEHHNPDALHIATEGPLGWAARAAAQRNGWAFTTAYHSRFPEYVRARIGVPLSWSYALFRKFHAPAKATMAPTPGIVHDLEARGFGHMVHWTRGVSHEIFYPRIQKSVRNKDNPVFLCVGRLAIEKNLDAFLKLDLPGQKWVVGVGPLQETLKRKYPDVRYIGVLPQDELAMLYSQADVFVFPSVTDTFGLVQAEAMACGLPVAAYPVHGPLDVVGDSGAGVLDHDLRQACLACLDIDSSAPVARAADFTWPIATAQFYGSLTRMRT